jgi:hypothetical protein
MNNANMYANWGTNAQTMPLNLLSSLLTGYTNVAGVNQTQTQNNTQQALDLLRMLME